MVLRKLKRGYSLIEVMVAMFVFGVGIMAVLSFFSGSLLYVNKVNQLTAAQRAVEDLFSYLDTLPLNDAGLSQGSHTIDWASVIPDSSERSMLMKTLGSFSSGYIVSDYNTPEGKVFKGIAAYVVWSGGGTHGKYIGFHTRD